MDREDIKYEINNCIEIRKNLWTALIVLTGGLAGLLLNMYNVKLNIEGIIKVGLFISGFVFDYLIFIMLGEVNTEIKELITKFKKENNK